MSIGIATPLLRLGWEACVEPGTPPAHQRARVRPSRRSQLARHTGARRFIGSGAVNDERAVTVEAELSRRSHCIVRRKPDRPARFEAVLVPRAFRPRVDELQFLTSSETRAEVVDRNGIED